ncbi:orotidine 5'-phosphate decarboxylase / HUMPS family protein [Micromonospora matsumotoense]|uniref:orotidine 5'-phosphate decarboxylase / HUMPS family protein n=1 Tax=Micromonospora matsumotoense TaxID=121616 RepID=UPI0033C9B0BC
MATDGGIYELMRRQWSQAHPEHVVIVDAKRGDIDNTNLYYAEAVFDTWGADVVTVHPYMGRESLEPFLRRRDKGSS